MKVTTVGGRSTGKTMAQLKQENDALKEQLSFLAGRVATLNEFCQVNNIGEWGDSVVSAVIKHCEGLAAQNAALVAKNHLLNEAYTKLCIGVVMVDDCEEGSAEMSDAFDMLFSIMRDNCDLVQLHPHEALRQIQADAIKQAVLATKTATHEGGQEWLCRVDSLRQYAERVKAGEC